MSVPSMVHRSGDALIVRSVVSGDALFGACDAGEDVVDDDAADVDLSDDAPEEEDANGKPLPECKIRRNYSCNGCDFFTQNPRHFLYHLRDVHKQKVKIYECPSCLYASKHFQKLVRHAKMVHGGARRGLTDDARRVAVRARSGNNKGRKRKLSEAEESDACDIVDDADVENNAMRCTLCPFAAKNPAQLGKHERDAHVKTKFFRCTKCTYATHMKARFTKHVKYHSMPMIKCERCDFSTPYKWNLDRHSKNHNGRGAFRCAACNFTADIKQSLTVHEMNHHVPPVGQAAGLGVGRRRNKVGASDSAAAATTSSNGPPPPAADAAVAAAPASAQQQEQQQLDAAVEATGSEIKKAHDRPKIASKKTKSASTNQEPISSAYGADFINPNDIVSHANGNIYIKNKCKLCNYKSAWDGEMAKHEQRVHNLVRPDLLVTTRSGKKTSRPVPNLIPLPTLSVISTLHKQRGDSHLLQAPDLPTPEPTMSQKDFNDICAKSANSSLRDFASLFGSEDVFDQNQRRDTSPNTVSPTPTTSTKSTFKQKNASFFDRLKEKLLNGAGDASNLTCQFCGHESKCLSELSSHQKTCGREETPAQHLPLIHNISSTRCQYCRQRCKSSADLFNHLQKCKEALKPANGNHLQQCNFGIRRDEDGTREGEPHPMENRIFVWNNIELPLEVEVEEHSYEYNPEEKQDDNISLDLSIRTHSPGSENSSLELQHHHQQQQQQQPAVAAAPPVEKVPTHGNDISTAQVAQHKRVFKCPHCSFWASTASRFHVHIVGHLNKKPFECSLCAYRSNWRWDITKHIKLKSVRDPAHEKAKVLMTDETGRRNYTKYNKYLTEIPLAGNQNETSGGAGTRPKVTQDSHESFPSSQATTMSTKSELPKLVRAPAGADFSPLLKASLRPPPPLKAADESFFAKLSSERKRSSAEAKKKLWKCKKCNFRDASHEKLVEHVKAHYQEDGGAFFANRDSPPPLGAPNTDDEASDTKLGGRGHAPFRCGHCHQVSNWKHVIQRHCRLKHSGDIRVVIGSKNGGEKVEIDEQIEEPDHVDIAQLGTFKCQQCPFSNDNHDDFELHLHDHLPKSDSIMKCYFCTFFVSHKEDLYGHLKLHGISEAEDYMSKMLEKTVNETDQAKRYKCLTCPYVTNSKSQFLYHKQFHKPRGGQYTCTYCSYNVSKRHLLHQHLKVHGITVTPQKQNGEVIDLDDLPDDHPDLKTFSCSFDAAQSFADIPLVWVSKGGKFAKMFKCRFCPHVNLRKVNIQEHEKMHGLRDKAKGGADGEHHCGECNYMCNNAGVLSSHSKVHQGLYGQIHCLVDAAKSDEEQIRELSHFINYQNQRDTDDLVLEEESETAESGQEEVNEEVPSSASLLYFCQYCPARFLKEAEFSIHNRFHGVRILYKCEYCNYAARQNSHLLAHKKVHTYEYQERTKVLQSLYGISADHVPPEIVAYNKNGSLVWVVKDAMEDEDLEIPTKIARLQLKATMSVPISGTELFQQKQNTLNEAMFESSRQWSGADGHLGALIHDGNPNFTYPTYLKNGRVKEKRYKCHKCPSAFEKREQYKVHLTLHGAKQRYKCDHCDYSVKYYANYIQHLKRHQTNDDQPGLKRSEDEDDDAMVVDEEETAPARSYKSLFQRSSTDKLSVADQQTEIFNQKRLTGVCGKDEEKKPYWCPNCPYTNARKDAVDNHNRRHISVSGITNGFTCEHCDYSVPQAHFLREHTKLHFGFSKMMQPEAYMMCDSIKLMGREADGERKCNGDEQEDVLFEDRGRDEAKEKRFVPNLDAQVFQSLNNNDEKLRLYINTETGEVMNETEESKS